MDADVQQAIDLLTNQNQDLLSQLQMIQGQLTLVKNFSVPTVIDSISQHNIKNIIPLFVTHTLLGTLCQTSTNYGQFFVADRPYQITGIAECHGVNSSSGTLSIFKTAPGGVDTLIMNSAFSTASSATIPQFATLLTDTTGIKLTLQQGDRLRCGSGGTLTNLTDQIIIVYLRPI
jgi:hypothetical protein